MSKEPPQKSDSQIAQEYAVLNSQSVFDGYMKSSVSIAAGLQYSLEKGFLDGRTSLRAALEMAKEVPKEVVAETVLENPSLRCPNCDVLQAKIEELISLLKAAQEML